MKATNELMLRVLKAMSDKSGDNTIAASAKLIINEYVALLTRHIAKENAVLFPMADAKLDSNKDTKLFEAFEKLERSVSDRASMRNFTNFCID